MNTAGLLPKVRLNLLKSTAHAVVGQPPAVKPPATCPGAGRYPKELARRNGRTLSNALIVAGPGQCEMRAGRPRALAGLCTTSAFRFAHSGPKDPNAPPTAAVLRRAHTDVKIPNFDEYRRSDNQYPDRARPKHEDRHLFHYFLLANLGWAGCVGGKTMAEMCVYNMSAAADVMALAKIEIKIDAVPEGKNVTFTWRGKPLFVRHRTAKEIDTVRAVDVSKLRDPEKDEDRVIDPRYLVIVGICTHLGCVPIAGMGDFGGYYCPCHGSHFDASGRVRKGPAPINLEVPVYEIKDELLIVG